MLSKIVGLVGGVIGVAAAWTDHTHVASACILLMCGLYFARRARLAN
jgi:hypothetical protein